MYELEVGVQPGVRDTVHYDRMLILCSLYKTFFINLKRRGQILQFIFNNYVQLPPSVIERLYCRLYLYSYAYLPLWRSSPWISEWVEQRREALLPPPPPPCIWSHCAVSTCAPSCLPDSHGMPVASQPWQQGHPCRPSGPRCCLPRGAKWWHSGLMKVSLCVCTTLRNTLNRFWKCNGIRDDCKFVHICVTVSWQFLLLAWKHCCTTLILKALKLL